MTRYPKAVNRGRIKHQEHASMLPANLNCSEQSVPSGGLVHDKPLPASPRSSRIIAHPGRA